MSSTGQPADLLAPRAVPDPATGVPASLREVMGQFATGVVLLTVGGANVHGMTANAFSAVSLDPPQILCCVAHTAVMHRALTAERGFGVSIMGGAQEDTARYFADKNRVLGPAQFDAIDCRTGPLTRAPLLNGALAWLECEVVDAHVSGDHSIFVGEVLSSTRGSGDAALLFFDGAFQSSLSIKTLKEGIA
ncbi:flavin reductase family protein [Winogradskya consettensis]|uniref:Oxidoreductase n=1 Tax=Winogradskya consettensis TaxID=113560 RepID=A0A919T178_9ACTN|nr:flavin reductase family protein [Actinoplanes consettensis]GIM81993.1 oxidoreductase [Actinoplanes consettensis]